MEGREPKDFSLFFCTSSRRVHSRHCTSCFLCVYVPTRVSQVGKTSPARAQCCVSERSIFRSLSSLPFIRLISGLLVRRGFLLSCDARHLAPLQGWLGPASKSIRKGEDVGNIPRTGFQPFGVWFGASRVLIPMLQRPNPYRFSFVLSLSFTSFLSLSLSLYLLVSDASCFWVSRYSLGGS